MGLERWVEYGWLRREPTSPVKSKVFWELWNVASPMQGSKPYRPISDSPLHSTWRFASLRLRSAHPVIAPQPKRVTRLRQSSHWNSL